MKICIAVICEEVSRWLVDEEAECSFHPHQEVLLLCLGENHGLPTPLEPSTGDPTSTAEEAGLPSCGNPCWPPPEKRKDNHGLSRGRRLACLSKVRAVLS